MFEESNRSVEAPAGSGEVKHANPLGLFIAVIREKPNAGQAAHLKAFERLIMSTGYDDFRHALVNEWSRIKYTTALNAATPPTVEKLRASVQRRKQERQAEEVAVREAKRRITSRLLDFMMPNDKPLRECTGAECIAFGGMFKDIGERVGPTEIVGDVLTVADIESLYGN